MSLHPNLPFPFCITGLELPPGPPGKPLVGHFFELPKLLNQTFMYEWKEKYGDIVSINSFGMPIVFIYSEKIAQELIEKRGSLYSDRPSFHMAWLQLLRDLLETPQNFSEHLKYAVGRIIIDVVYAIDVKPENDPFLDVIHMALEGVGYAILPGLWLIDIFPKLNSIPDWVPGIPFKNFMKKYKEATLASTDIPFDVVKNRTSPDHSFVSASLQRLGRLTDPSPEEEVIIKDVAGTAYSAGAGTTYATLLQAAVASILHPDVQEKVHEELDRVLGDRLPTLEEIVLRWRTPLPLGIAHAILEDDIYGDYFIPKGSVIIADSWQILRDKKYGPDPESFNPERFTQSGSRPPIEQFGFGRRLCPGRFFAENMLFLLAASIFKVFDIVPKKDEDGNDILVTDRIIESLLS
ncbi:hypothetical protein Clacol_007798 [Clathrus columnatus]|uniref:Cytochrome P450 n=1 Tax=Clathrus columnatus TaxID=1419009 RepID=A0AAV5ALI0_9AGAM|nr:hypothetical protein Clacol_007798 [Clathrus columnatus]